MISLDIENYCHECSKFEPECTKLYYDGGKCTTLVSCENKGVCANIKVYIEQQAIKRERPDYMPTTADILKENKS